jgi:glycosyltransferase involved in cell wall biosynthesis
MIESKGQIRACVYLNLPLGSRHGWGVCGKYITRELAKLEAVRLITEPFEDEAIGHPLEAQELRGVLLGQTEIERFPIRDEVRFADGSLLQGIANYTLTPINPRIRGKTTLGYTFFELNLVQPAWIENGRRCFDRVISGSSWCTRILAEAGLDQVATVVQGIDPAVFYPATGVAAVREFLADKFAVFSGGKFELRKGQDLVIRAFKVLQDRHPDAVLVNAWFNPWPETMQSMSSSRLIRITPQNGPYVQVINRILADNGIDLRRVITCPPQSNFAMARIYRNTDVGLFPNRCEGGTNLVLMEYMACGQPVVAVNSTGHADIVNSGNALVIASKGSITLHCDQKPIAVWPEPDLDDTIDKLEWAYQHREALRDLGRQAAQDLARWTWRRTAETFQKLIWETAGQ